MFDILGSDIVVMQELKIQRKDLRDDMVLLDGWDCYFSLPKHKKGYSGVGVYTRNATCAPMKAEEGLLGVLPSPTGVPYCNMPETDSIGGYPNAQQVVELGVDPVALDAEGRCVVVEFPAFVLFGVYCPANSNGLRDDFRHAFIGALDCRIRNLVRTGKRVVLVGDLNVNRDEIDTASAADDMRKAGITHEDYISTPNRRIFNQLLIEGEVVGVRDEGREAGVLWDTTRAFHPDRRGMYTHWEQKINARPGNYGSRIDFVLVSETMKTWIRDGNIQEGLLGSDHCPVYVDFHEDVDVDGEKVALLDKMSPSGTFASGKRKVEWKIQNVPAYSARRMPEFDKRRSIKSMFAAPSLKKAQSSTNGAENGDPVSSSADVAADMPLAVAARPTEPSRAPSFTAPATALNSPSPVKRKASLPSSNGASKRQRSDAQHPKSKGQQSLKGFFQKSAPLPPVGMVADSAQVKGGQSEEDSQDTAPPGTTVTSTRVNERGPPSQTLTASANGSVKSELVSPKTSPPGSPTSNASTADFSPSKFSAQLESAERNQKNWNNLFSRPVAPLCEGHQEPCKSMLTKKKGSNQGRSFWMCVRPLGPSGNKEKGTQWRCPTFIWSSDWTGKER